MDMHSILYQDFSKWIPSCQFKVAVEFFNNIGQSDVCLRIKLQKNFTKYPNILSSNQLRYSL